MEEHKKKNLIRRLYDFAFKEDLSWNDWFFERVYKDEEAFLLTGGGNALSCLLLQKYGFWFHGEETKFGYICGATTDVKSRHKGYMGELMVKALQESYARGDVFAGLIPASRLLYFFYDKFSFSTVVFSEIERYTSAHVFPKTEGYKVTAPSYSGLSKLERERRSTILHSEEGFNNILEDIAHDKGTVVQIDNAEGETAALAFATVSGAEIHVKELLGSDALALDMALGAVQEELRVEMPMVVWREPSGRSSSMRSRGMIRIINVEKALETLASKNPKVDQVIRVSDKIIPENTGIYILKDGKCTRVDHTLRHLSLDVTVDVLAKIIFSGERIGKIFNLPTCHPMMPLMLD